MSTDRGWFAVGRDIFKDRFFADEPYTELQAWLWLVSEASWGDRRVRATNGRAFQMVDLKPGQLCRSLRVMQEAWRWSSDKRVRTFLKRLKTDARIDFQSDALVTVITICNYDASKPLPMDQDAQTDAQTDAQRTRNGRKSKKDNNYKKDIIALGFDAFWAIYPRKDGKKAAFKAYERVVSSGKISPDELLECTKVYAAQREALPAKDQQFTPHAATWLNGERFTEVRPSLTGVAAPVVRDPGTFTDAQWHSRLKHYQAGNPWLDSWGPEFGRPGCLVPSHVAAGASS